MLYLPQTTADKTGDEALPADEPLADGNGARVLVVEDNPGVGAFAVASLAQLGFEPVLMIDALRALDLLSREADRFEVVFSDVVMPGMNGVDFGREVERLHPGLPVVLTSGYSEVLIRDGRDGFDILAKPYSIDELQRMLSRRARKRADRLTLVAP